MRKAAGIGPIRDLTKSAVPTGEVIIHAPPTAVPGDRSAQPPLPLETILQRYNVCAGATANSGAL